MFPRSGTGRETATLLGPSERANLNHFIVYTQTMTLYISNITEVSIQSET
jgi:hypothetical protein